MKIIDAKKVEKLKSKVEKLKSSENFIAMAYNEALDDVLKLAIELPKNNDGYSAAS